MNQNTTGAQKKPTQIQTNDGNGLGNTLHSQNPPEAPPLPNRPVPGPPTKVGSSKGQKLNLPAQLAALIQGEVQELRDDGFLMNSAGVLEEEEGVDLGLGSYLQNASEKLLGCDEDENTGTQKKLTSTTKKKSATSSSAATPYTMNQITASAQGKCTKELSSYVRSVCMRMGFNKTMQ